MAWTGRPQPAQFSNGDDFPDNWDDLLKPYQGRNMGCCAEAMWNASPAFNHIRSQYPDYRRREALGPIGIAAGGWSENPDDQRKGGYEQAIQMQWQRSFLPWFKRAIRDCHLPGFADAQDLIQGEHEDPYWYTTKEIGESVMRLVDLIDRVLDEAAEEGNC